MTSFNLYLGKTVDYFVPKTIEGLKEWINRYYNNYLNKEARLSGMRKTQLLAIYHAIRRQGL